jgi:hypothetical protein
MAGINTTKYALKDILAVTGFDTVNGQHLFTADDLQSATFSNASDQVWATGLAGVRITGWDTNKTATLSFENGTITEGLLAVQTGTEVENLTNFSGLAKKAEIITVGTGVTSVTMTHLTTGTAGNELGWIYKRNPNDGSLTIRYPQGATASATEFSFDPATRTITLPTDGTFVAGDEVVVYYSPILAAAKRIHNAADSFPETVELYADCFFRNICNDKDYFAQIIMKKAKASGSFDWSMGGDPTVQGAEFEALTGCTDKTLWDVVIWDEDDMLTADSNVPVQAVGAATGTELTNEIVVTLTAGTFADAASTISNWTIGGANGAALGDITNVNVVAGNASVVLTTQNALGDNTNVYTITVNSAAYATNVTPIAGAIPVTVTNA